jgi:PDZ domain-containing secreted protein
MLVSINGRTFSNVTELGNWVLTKKIGDKVEIVVKRLNETRSDKDSSGKIIIAEYDEKRITCTIGERNWKDE